MISFKKMTQDEFDAYCNDSIKSLADETARAFGLDSSEALRRAQASFNRLLPDSSPNQPDQFLYSVIDEQEQRIGAVWFGIKRDKPQPEVYLWDIVIDQQHRGCGYGRAVMLALENEVRCLGLSTISLNVFRHNLAAKELYEKLAYKPISQPSPNSTIMAKHI